MASNTFFFKYVYIYILFLSVQFASCRPNWLFTLNCRSPELLYYMICVLMFCVLFLYNARLRRFLVLLASNHLQIDASSPAQILCDWAKNSLPFAQAHSWYTLCEWEWLAGLLPGAGGWADLRFGRTMLDESRRICKSTVTYRAKLILLK